MKTTRIFSAFLVAAVTALLPAMAQTSHVPPQHTAPQRVDGLVNGYRPAWWKEAVVYQVYPRSFKDSNGDGIGDLNGLTSKLDYLQKLGVNVIWLSPHYDSPNADNGYDIRDYRKVMAEFGTMADFDRMLAGIKKRRMRLIIDLVVNHTSDEHRWFVESRKSKDNPYRDYYIWREGKPNPAAPHGFDPPNNYKSFFSGSAWEWNEATKDFYLHLFAVKQPDLNWENPKVREDVYSLMRFWLDKGVDGFRMDVIPLISKQPGLPDVQPHTDYVTLWANGPRRDEFLQEMNAKVLSKYDDMSVGEAIGITLEETPRIVGENRHELSEIFNFDAMRLNRGDFYAERTWTLPELKAIYDKHATVLGKGDWDTVFLSNHDNPRLASNFGDGSAASAKMLEAMLLTLRGTVYLYEGDELGMTNYPFTKVSEFDDIEVKNAYKERVLGGQMTEAEFLRETARFGRDNSRTPMQWDGSAHGGFTTGSTTWEPVNPDYTTVNVAAEEKDPDSVLHFTQQMIALRHKAPALVYGDYKDLAPDDKQVFAYTRTLGAERYLVVLNFSRERASFPLPAGMDLTHMVIHSQKQMQSGIGAMDLAPWEARVYKF